MKKIIISGSNGFVGSSLGEILAGDFIVTSLVRRNSKTDFVSPNTNIVYVNYEDIIQLSKVIEGNNIFIHCAAATKAKSWEEMKKINVDLTANILKACNKSSTIEQFVFISSQAAAGPSDNYPKNENDECNPISWYGKSKLLAEKIIKDNATMPFTIIRPSSVYGPKDKDFLQYFKLMKKHLAIQIGFSESTIAMIYIKELIKFIKLTLLNPISYNQTFFAAEKNYSISEFIDALKKAMNIKVIKIKIPEAIPSFIAVFNEVFSYFSTNTPLLNKEKVKELKIKNWTVSTEKAKRLLKYEPDQNLEQHLYETYKWYKKNGWL